MNKRIAWCTATCAIVITASVLTAERTLAQSFAVAPTESGGGVGRAILDAGAAATGRPDRAQGSTRSRASAEPRAAIDSRRRKRAGRGAGQRQQTGYAVELRRHSRRRRPDAAIRRNAEHDEFVRLLLHDPSRYDAAMQRLSLHRGGKTLFPRPADQQGLRLHGIGHPGATVVDSRSLRFSSKHHARQDGTSITNSCSCRRSMAPRSHMGRGRGLT